jgi:hypothetical protein
MPGRHLDEPIYGLTRSMNPGSGQRLLLSLVNFLFLAP